MRAEVKRFARKQHGLVTRAQVLQIYSEQKLRTLVDRGELEFVARSLYRIGGAPVTWRQKVLAAVLSAGPGAVASHATAAALWGLSGFPPKVIEIAVPHGGSRRSALATVHQTRSLEPTDVTTIDGIPITRVARTLIDLAASVPTRRVEEALDDALCRRLVNFVRLERRNEKLKAQGRPNLDEVLKAWTPGNIADSVAEMRIVRRLLAHGLPAPERQVEVLGFRVDLFYRANKVVIEYESIRWHWPPEHQIRTMARRNALTAAKYKVIQATVADMKGDGRDLCAKVRAVLNLPEG
jgi:very-short-patch-repair endonuclease